MVTPAVAVAILAGLVPFGLAISQVAAVFSANTATATANSATATFFVTGSAYAAGDPTQGQTGTIDLTPYRSPMKTGVGVSTVWAMVDAGSNQTCGIETTGALWCWGTNNYGQLGQGDTTNRLDPTQVGGLVDLGECEHHLPPHVRDAYRWHLVVLGDNPAASSDWAIQLTAPYLPRSALANTWNRVSTGIDHTCATRTDGTLWCWGNGFSGQLGMGDMASRHHAHPGGCAHDLGHGQRGAELHLRDPHRRHRLVLGDERQRTARRRHHHPAPRPNQVGAVTTWAPISGGGGSHLRHPDRWHRLVLGRQHHRPAR